MIFFLVPLGVPWRAKGSTGQILKTVLTSFYIQTSKILILSNSSQTKQSIMNTNNPVLSVGATSVRLSMERTLLLHHVSVSLQLCAHQQGYWSVLTISRLLAAQLILSRGRECLFLLSTAIKYKLRTIWWEIKHREQGIRAGVPQAQP